MAGEFAVYIDSFLAAGDLSAYQNCFVKLSAANTVDVATAGAGNAGDKVVGVLKNAPNEAGKACTVQILGICEVAMNGATDIAAGDWIKSAAAGVGIKAATNLDNVVGQSNGAWTDNSTALVEIILTGPFGLSV